MARPVSVARWLRAALNLLALGLVALGLLAPRTAASNPLIEYRYNADPTARVWSSDPDTLYIYASHDQDEAHSHDEMIDYYVYSTKDMVTWEDHGMVLHLDNVTWAQYKAWAPDAAYVNGTYYLVFCAIEEGQPKMRTGLAVSSRPEGPFHDTGYIDGVDWGQDPNLFVDGDGTPYLYWGLGGKAWGAQLTPDLRAILRSTKRDVTKELPSIYEGPWVYKAPNGYYTIMYPALRDPGRGQTLEYATARHPLGPWQHRGEIMDDREVTGTFSWTNHGSITEFKGQWYLFYHVAWQSPSNDKRRNICAERLHHNADGTIDHIAPTREGVPAVPVAAGGADHDTTHGATAASSEDSAHGHTPKRLYTREGHHGGGGGSLHVPGDDGIRRRSHR